MAEQRQGQGRRLTDRISGWIGVLLVLLVAELAVILVAQFVPVGVDSTQNAQINRIPLEAAYDTRLASFNGCVRANPGRKAQVRAALAQADGNRARADAWRLLIPLSLPSAFGTFISGQIAANEQEAMDADDYAATLIKAQASVAKHPEAKDPVDRVAVDCSAVYPLPVRRGEPLPEPTKP